MRICLIFNPAAKGEKSRRLLNQLASFQSNCVLKQTTTAGDARRLAEEAVREGCETIIAAGGDGTVNEVLNGIGDAPDGFEKCRLGILPVGTVNVFARELGLPLNVSAAWEIIQQGNETRMDLPGVEYISDGLPARRCFAQLAGAGLDARAIERLNWPLKKKIGPLAYVVAGLDALRAPQSKISVTAEGKNMEGELILIGNGRLYGGPFRLFPQADLRDGLLDVCVFPRVNWPVLLRCGPGLLINGKLPAGAAQHFQCATVKLASQEKVLFQLDGELVGQIPATFSIQRSALRVIVPAKKS